VSDLGDAKATISIDVAGVTQGVAAATRSLETLDKSFVGAGQSAAKLGPAMTAPLQKAGSAIADMGKMAAGFALGGAITQAPALLLDMAKAAAADEKATARLSQTLENLPGNFGQMNAAVNDAIDAGQKLAFSDDDVRDSFQSLAVATGSAEEALKRQQIAMDLSRGAGIPLTAASKMLGKVTEENVDAFKKLGINIAEGASEAEALAAVQKKFAGQADTYAKSTAGQFEQAQLALGEIQEGIGSALLPVLSAVGVALADNLPAIQEFVGALGQGVADQIVPAMEALAPVVATVRDGLVTLVGAVQGDWLPAAGIDPFSTAMGLLGIAIKTTGEAVLAIIGFFKDNDVAMGALVVVTTALTTAYALATAATIAHNVATKAVSIATQAYTAIQWLLNAALTANPIGLVVVALAALAAGVIYAYQNSETFRGIVDGLWKAIQEHVIPAFTDFMTWAGKLATEIGDKLGPVVKVVAETVLPLLVKPILDFINAVKIAVGWIGDLINAIKSIPTPSLPSLPGLPGGGGGGPTGRAAPSLALPYVYTPPPAAMLRSGASGGSVPIWSLGGGSGSGANRAATAPAIRIEPMSLSHNLRADGDINASLVQGVQDAFDQFGAALVTRLGDTLKREGR
jgi:hypothetical protein